MYRSNLNLIILSVLFLAGCGLSKPESRQNEDGAATFFVKSSDIEVTQSILDKNLSIPIARTFNFKVCVNDNKRSKEIINQEFHILGGEKEISLKSDKNGCVIWSENIAFNAMAKAANIKIERKLSAAGVHKGQKTLGFAINPWESTAYSLKDTEVTTIDGEAGLKALAGEGISNSLWFDDLRLTIEEKGTSPKGARLSFEVRTQPGLAMESSAGKRTFEPLTYGEFKISLSLIHAVSENQKDIIRQLQAPVQVTSKMTASSLYFQVPMTLEKICTRGQVQMGLKIEPINAPKNVKPFEGVFIIGDCDQIKGNMFSRMKNVAAEQGGDFRIENYLTEKTELTAVTPSNQAGTSTNTAQPDYYQTGQIEIKKLSFNNVGYRDQRTIQKERVFNISACMKSGLDQKAMRAQTFTVTKVNGETTQVRTNDDGCLSWDDSYKFNYLAQECWKETSVTLANSNLGVNQKIQLNINPWSSNESFLRDVRFTDKAGQELVCAKGQSEIILTSYDFDKKSFDYAVDEFLNLRVKKTGLLKLSPRLKRPSLTESTGFAEENLPIGKYLLKWAIVDMANQDLRKPGAGVYQTGSKVITNNGASTFVENITFETRSITAGVSGVKAMGNTNQLVLEIYPLNQDPKQAGAIEIDVDAEMALTAVRGPIILANNNDSGTLEVYEKSGRSIVDGLERHLKNTDKAFTARLKALSTKEYFASDAKLQLMNLNDAKSTQNMRRTMQLPGWKEFIKDPAKISEVSTKELTDLFKTKVISQELGAHLCDYWIADRLNKPLVAFGHRAAAITNSVQSFKLRDFCVAISRRANLKLPNQHMFAVEWRYFVKSPTLEKTQPFSTFAKEFSVNHSFQLVNNFGNSLTKSMSWDASMGLKLLDIPFLSGSTGIRYSVSKATTESQGYGNSASFQAGVSSIYEKLSFRVLAPAYETCAVIRIRPEMYNDASSPMTMAANKALSEKQILESFGSGIVLCEGQITNKAVNFQEDYYFINQRPLPLQATDNFTDATRPFFMSLRGVSDFNSFMSFLHADNGIPSSAKNEDHTAEMNSGKLKDVYKSAIPAYPGQYIRTK